MGQAAGELHRSRLCGRLSPGYGAGGLVRGRGLSVRSAGHGGERVGVGGGLLARVVRRRPAGRERVGGRSVGGRAAARERAARPLPCLSRWQLSQHSPLPACVQPEWLLSGARTGRRRCSMLPVVRTTYFGRAAPAGRRRLFGGDLAVGRNPCCLSANPRRSCTSPRQLWRRHLRGSTHQYPIPAPRAAMRRCTDKRTPLGRQPWRSHGIRKCLPLPTWFGGNTSTRCSN